jgi:hypothetical protein
LIAMFCDGCVEEFVSNDAEELKSFVRFHYDHQTKLDVVFIPEVSIDPLLGIRQNGILQREHITPR